jgi:hypothetical protein
MNSPDTTRISLARLELLLGFIPPLLRNIDQDAFAAKPAPEKWSRLEILGHLCDSASNNIQRLIRVQYEDAPRIAYDQNAWVRCGRHQEMDAAHLVAYWTALNAHFLAVARLLPADVLDRVCLAGAPEPVTMAFLIDDYLRHLEHHLHQLVAYE